MILIFVIGLVLLRIAYSLGEIYFERDWPRHTWRGLMISLGLLLMCCSAFGQAARVDLPLQTYGPNVPSGAGPLPQALWLSNVSVYACVHPSVSLSACQASPITTYTDSTEGTTCHSTTQLVQLPGSTCTASAGAAANVGLWYQGGIFDYWVVASYGTFGPFTYNAPAAIGGNYVSKLLTTPQTILSNLNMPYINTIPQADQFAGSDICVKIRAAATYALANNINQVDATHFSGTQACSVDMLGSIATVGTTVKLAVNLGAVHIQSSVAQTITNSGVALRGMGPMETQIEYTGVSLVPAVLQIGGSYGLNNVKVDEVFLYGGVANATDGLLVFDTSHSQFNNVWTWGVVSAGIHTESTVTDTFYTPRTSAWDATFLGIYNASHTTPNYCLNFDKQSGGVVLIRWNDHRFRVRICKSNWLVPSIRAGHDVHRWNSGIHRKHNIDTGAAAASVFIKEPIALLTPSFPSTLKARPTTLKTTEITST